MGCFDLDDWVDLKACFWDHYHTIRSDNNDASRSMKLVPVECGRTNLYPYVYP